LKYEIGVELDATEERIQKLDARVVVGSKVRVKRKIVDQI
jgi:hypothetical protein